MIYPLTYTLLCLLAWLTAPSWWGVLKRMQGEGWRLSEPPVGVRPGVEHPGAGHQPTRKAEGLEPPSVPTFAHRPEREADS